MRDHGGEIRGDGRFAFIRQTGGDADHLIRLDDAIEIRHDFQRPQQFRELRKWLVHDIVHQIVGSPDPSLLGESCGIFLPCPAFPVSAAAGFKIGSIAMQLTRERLLDLGAGPKHPIRGLAQRGSAKGEHQAPAARHR